MADRDRWRVAHRLLRRRVDRIPVLLRRAAAARIGSLPFIPRAARAIVTTGIGSSAAHAKLLAHLLAAEHGLPARFAPPAALAANPHPADALIVFSQGLSPNVRVALREPRDWLGVVVVTAVESRSSTPELRALIGRLDAARALRLTVPGGAERGALLRLAGPVAAQWLVFRLANAIARADGVGAPEPSVERIITAMSAAAARARRAAAGGDPFGGRVALVASGGYGELADNLRLKLVEGLYEPLPPVSDLLDVAHGAFQALYDRAATFVALERRDAAGEADLLKRLTAMLDPDRHRLLRLPATLPGPLALFEHEAALNELALAAIAARRLDQAHWPGQERDRPLYQVATNVAGAASPAPRIDAANALAELHWPEIAARLTAGRRTAVIPLGSTEQHGAHLPFATDTLIADALATRLCARIDAVHVPAIGLGCAAEHGGFAGSLSLRWDSLRALLEDTIGSLARHGFESILVFTAHGGNAALLRDSAPDLAAAGRPATVRVCADLDALTAIFHRASSAAGVSPAAAGHHAGEFETSILMALRPDLVRRDALASGVTRVGPDPQTLFYPDLRANAPHGVVGDPRAASAARGAAYLEAWVEHLAAWAKGRW